MVMFRFLVALGQEDVYVGLPLKAINWPLTMWDLCGEKKVSSYVDRKLLLHWVLPLLQFLLCTSMSHIAFHCFECLSVAVSEGATKCDA